MAKIADTPTEATEAEKPATPAKPKVDMSMVPDQYKSESGKYKSGHDARHVSDLLGGLRREADQGEISAKALNEASKSLPSEGLKTKLANAVERHNSTYEEKAAKAAEREKAKAEREAAKEKAAEEKAAEKAKAKEAREAAAAEKKAAKEQEKAEKAAKAEAAKAEAGTAQVRTVDASGEMLGYQETTVKVGRTEFPARKYTDGSIERNTKKDGTGDWVEVEA